MSPLSTAFNVVFPFFKSSICLTNVATALVVLRHRHTKNECDFLMFSHRLYFVNVGLKSLIILFCLFCQNLLSSFSYLFPWRFGKVITVRLWSKHRRARDLKRNNSPLCDSFQFSERENNGREIRKLLASALEINQSSSQTRWTNGICEKLIWGN